MYQFNIVIFHQTPQENARLFNVLSFYNDAGMMRNGYMILRKNQCKGLEEFENVNISCSTCTLHNTILSMRYTLFPNQHLTR